MSSVPLLRRLGSRIRPSDVPPIGGRRSAAIPWIDQNQTFSPAFGRVVGRISLPGYSCVAKALPGRGYKVQSLSEAFSFTVRPPLVLVHSSVVILHRTMSAWSFTSWLSGLYCGVAPALITGGWIWLAGASQTSCTARSAGGEGGPLTR